MRGFASLVVLALIATTAAVKGWERPSETQSRGWAVSIGIYDYEGVRPEQLRRARDAVDRLFTSIDVQITWLGPYRISDLQLHDRFDLSRAPDLAVLVLNAKMTRALGPRADTLGCAPGTALARGRVAYLFYERLAKLVWAGEEVVNLLSIVMAHEIGHLLLPHESHSETGVMRSRWSITELLRADLDRVGFTSSQVAAIRRRVSGNNTVDRHTMNLDAGNDWSDEPLPEPHPSVHP